MPIGLYRVARDNIKGDAVFIFDQALPHILHTSILPQIHRLSVEKHIGSFCGSRTEVVI